MDELKKIYAMCKPNLDKAVEQSIKALVLEYALFVCRNSVGV